MLGVSGIVFTITILHISGYMDLVREVYKSRVVNLLIDYEGGFLYSSGRDVLFSRAFELGMARPIFGSGLDSFETLGFGVYPHNILLEIFVEGGLVGLLLFSLLITFVINLIVTQRERIYRQNLVALGFVFAASQFSGDIYNSIGIIILTLLVCIPRHSKNGFYR
jgi:O-antigen ligase